MWQFPYCLTFFFSCTRLPGNRANFLLYRFICLVVSIANCYCAANSIGFLEYTAMGFGSWRYRGRSYHRLYVILDPDGELVGFTHLLRTDEMLGRS